MNNDTLIAHLYTVNVSNDAPAVPELEMLGTSAYSPDWMYGWCNFVSQPYYKFIRYHRHHHQQQQK